MEEIWKDINDYEGLYQISNLGRIKSLKRKVDAGNGKMRWQYERIMSNKKQMEMVIILFHYIRMAKVKTNMYIV